MKPGRADADVHLAMCHAATTPATAKPGAVDDRRPPVRRAGPGWWPGWPPGCWGWPGVCRCGHWSWCRRTRVAQTSLVLDAGGRRLAALHGPEDRTAVPL